MAGHLSELVFFQGQQLGQTLTDSELGGLLEKGMIDNLKFAVLGRQVKNNPCDDIVGILDRFGFQGGL